MSNFIHEEIFSLLKVIISKMYIVKNKIIGMSIYVKKLKLDKPENLSKISERIKTIKAIKKIKYFFTKAVFFSFL